MVNKAVKALALAGEAGVVRLEGGRHLEIPPKVHAPVQLERSALLICRLEHGTIHHGLQDPVARFTPAQNK